VATKVTIGEREFSSKKDAQNECRRILYSLPTESIITDRNDHQFLNDLVMRHPDAVQKVGVGILRYEIRSNPTFPSQRCLYLIRTDGTGTDFSFLKCITAPTPRHLVLDAMRKEIAPQVVAVARAAFAGPAPATCALTGQVLDSLAHAHVDHHDPTFLRLATDFVDLAGGWDALPVHRGDGLIGVRLANQDHCTAWSEYHARTARLRVV